MKQPNNTAPYPALPLGQAIVSGHAAGLRRAISGRTLTTVCEEARCPNRMECYAAGTATFMILGDRCTRNCMYCAVAPGPPCPSDDDEPERVAGMIVDMGLRYAVVTSVTRDDLPDGGAACFARTVACVRDRQPDIGMEVLTPDFQGDGAALEDVLDARPTVYTHNLETVERLFPTLRPGGRYRLSLDLLANAGEYSPDIPRKSGLMLGLGETDAEIEAALTDLRAAGVTLLTLGQYRRPSSRHTPVARYLSCDDFDRWRDTALAKGFAFVASGPRVRSSYHAEELARYAGVPGGVD
jgi:lipoyl synthase